METLEHLPESPSTDDSIVYNSHLQQTLNHQWGMWTLESSMFCTAISEAAARCHGIKVLVLFMPETLEPVGGHQRGKGP